MEPSVASLVRLLESYRGRDKVVRSVCFGSQLLGGLLTRRDGEASSLRLGKRLLLFSAQLSHCRTVMRLFDDLSMLAYCHGYGLGGGEEDGAVRCVSLLANMADQLFYPCEHMAWAADARLIEGKSDRWWLLSTALWATSLLLGILSRSQLHSQMRRELLSILSSMADLANAVHWMPPGFLWAGRFPNWLVGLMGSISSLIGLMSAGDSDETASP
ncbi:peroxisomal membrane protein 11C-like isoform X2 [Pseudoliparis swirei]|uniref:peroxisomal membrane protein 11C-like isoform X2 n=1 Tax=Pseudoliparis swirei TaxID=2059687 RepID=UPI0024BE147D|nr:peroxisomal membrane protein 11C-like isoform X2 [Pseudoliparis swirei]